MYFVRFMIMATAVGCPDNAGCYSSISSERMFVSAWKLPLILASGSPRRVRLLAEAGFDAISCPPVIDDGEYTCGTMDARTWVCSLAVLKAQHVRELRQEIIGTVLAADTVCVVDGEILGQPTEASDAKQMLLKTNNRSHEVCTGWCLISLGDGTLLCECDNSVITIGNISEEEIDSYVATNKWQGKAGAYNLSERLQAGWPITCSGDPTSVMGLPMKRVKKILHHCTREH
jgi:septum formation protein